MDGREIQEINSAFQCTVGGNMPAVESMRSLYAYHRLYVHMYHAYI